jgi:glycosyltransferase involved in cell wall biosynthesis
VDYPKISILIPTYNRSKYLTCCIDSVLFQDYPNFEVIVSDNHSIDSTSQVIEKYLSDKRVRYYRNEINIGIIPNWKILLYEYATGEYGKLIPDDDYLLDKGHLKKGMDLYG